MLKNIKSDIRADFVRTDQHGIIIIMNKVASTSDLQMVENYVKNVDYLDSKDIKILYLLLWDALDMNNFYFLFLLSSDFIGILFSFSFLLDNEEACDTAVT